MVGPQPSSSRVTVAILAAAMLATVTAGCSSSAGEGLPASAAPAQTTGTALGQGPDGDSASSDGVGPDSADPLDGVPGAESTGTGTGTGMTVDPVSGLPHFQGSLDIRLTAGTRVVGFRYCEPSPERGRLCSADEQSTYLTYPESTADVVLTDVTMVQNEQHTAWAMTLTVDDAKAAKRAGRFAVSRAGLLLFVGPEDSVVLTHRPVTIPEPSIKSGTITFPAGTKAEAWDLVESMEALA